MFAIVFKNIVIVILIISILYFLIENHLNENETITTRKCNKNNKPEFKPVEKQKKNNFVRDFIKKTTSNVYEEDIVVEEEQYDKYEPKEVQKANFETSKSMKINIDPDLKEIYDYVYDDGDATYELEEIYDNTKVRDTFKDKSIFCESSEHIKVKNMCSTPILDHHEVISYDNIQAKPVTENIAYGSSI